MSALKQFPKAVKELRLHLCQTGQASAGVRQFIQSQYPSLKSSNPEVKLMFREAAGIEPKAFVRFERGVESQQSLAGLSEKDVASTLNRWQTELAVLEEGETKIWDAAIFNEAPESQSAEE